MTEDWVKVIAAGEVVPGEIVEVKVDGEPVALARSEAGEFMATSNICTHEYEFLHEGWLEGVEIECPAHGSMFNMKTGEVRNLPATQPIEVYEVKVEDDEVYLRGPREGGSTDE